MNWYKRASESVLAEHGNVYLSWDTFNSHFYGDGVLVRLGSTLDSGFYQITVTPNSRTVEVTAWSSVEFKQMEAVVSGFPWESVLITLKFIRKSESGKMNVYEGSAGYWTNLSEEEQKTVILDLKPWPEMKITGYMDGPDNPPAVELRRKWKPWK